MSPNAWIDSLFASIKQTQCKENGVEISLENGYEKLTKILADTKQNRKRLYWIGNGGSQAICSHLSQDCLNKLGVMSQNISDSSLITCFTNDYGYDVAYARVLEVLFSEGDTLIALSSSGNSQNILNGINVAKEKSGTVVSLSSFDVGNSLNKQDVDLSFYLPSQLYGHAEVGHEAILHSVIETSFLNL